MPDKRTHRGKHPDDDHLFAAAQHDALRTAVAELSWLLTNGYAPDSALKLVGDRHGLTARQRMAVRRSACSDQALQQRRATLASLERCAGSRIAIDGYNLLITVESALSGGLVMVGRDGCYRDLASIHSTYRKVEETVPALQLIAGHLARTGIAGVDWYLDRPVSNSGRLKALMAATLERQAGCVKEASCWNIELVDSPDAVLATCDGPVVTTDSVILDRCRRWVNLGQEMIDAHVPHAWKVDLRHAALRGGEQ